mmetsp:Transcript_164003/g.521419  ORF Transcript_164003/g.521419 Transcript_164003/m.521419 type:complete len:474 (-) Transcript_164003:42-1463(-)
MAAVLTLTRVVLVEGAAIRDVPLVVRNPPRASDGSRNQWLAIGRGSKKGEELGWGEHSQDYVVVSMSVNLQYTPQRGNITMVATFEITPRALGILTGAGAALEIKYLGIGGDDSGVFFQCYQGDPVAPPNDWVMGEDMTWRRVGAWFPLQMLPGLTMTMQPCEAPGAKAVSFNLAGLSAGQVTFAVRLLQDSWLGRTLADSVSWDITLRDEANFIVDMFPELKQSAWLPSLGVQPLPLVWTASFPGERATIIVAFDLLNENGLELHTICVRFPSGFNHSRAKVSKLFGGEKESILEVLDSMPRDWPWVRSFDDTLSDRFCIQANTTNLTVGLEYSFTFGILVPKESRWPATNIWPIDFCNHACLANVNASSSDAANSSALRRLAEVNPDLSNASDNSVVNTSNDTGADGAGQKETTMVLQPLIEDMTITYFLLGFKPNEVHPSQVMEKVNIAHRSGNMLGVCLSVAIVLAVHL